VIREHRTIRKAWVCWRGNSQVPADFLLEAKLLGMVCEGQRRKVDTAEMRLRRWRLEHEWWWLAVLCGRLPGWKGHLPKGDFEGSPLFAAMLRMMHDEEGVIARGAPGRLQRPEFPAARPQGMSKAGSARAKTPSRDAYNREAHGQQAAGMKRWRGAEVAASIAQALRRVDREDVAEVTLVLQQRVSSLRAHCDNEVARARTSEAAAQESTRDARHGRQELQALLDAAENAHESQHTQLQEELWSSQRELRQARLEKEAAQIRLVDMAKDFRTAQLAHVVETSLSKPIKMHH